MDFKPAIILMGRLIVLLIAIGALLITSAATIGLGGFYIATGVLNLAFGAYFLGKRIIELIKADKF